MSYNPDTRQKALHAALEGLRGSGLGHDVDAILRAARKIEAYLNGTDTKPEQTGGGSGVSITGGTWTNPGFQGASQGMPQ